MVPAAPYKERDIIDMFSKMKKMSVRQFRKWVVSYGRASYEAGLREGEAEGAWWSDDEIFRILRSERIGEEKAHRIISKLLERKEGANNGRIENL